MGGDAEYEGGDADFGATPVTGAAANSMFDYISGGIVDGAVTGKGSLISFQLARYTKFITYFPGQLGYNAETFFMNETQIRQPLARGQGGDRQGLLRDDCRAWRGKASSIRTISPIR